MKKYSTKKIIILTIILILSVVCLCLVSNKQGFSTPTLKVFIYENSTEPTRTQNLEKLLTYFGYNDYSILGEGDPWEGWYGRNKKYREAIERLDDDQFVLFSDGRDVIINNYCSEFIDRATHLYDRIEKGVIFNSEQYCCNLGKEYTGTDEDAEKYKESIKAKFMSRAEPYNTIYPFLNAGVMFGKCRDFKELFSNMDLKPGEDDQGVIMKMHLNDNYDDFYLDYKNDLFCVSYGELEWDDAKKMYLNPITGSYPFVIHFPAKVNAYVDSAEKLMNATVNESPLV